MPETEGGGVFVSRGSQLRLKNLSISVLPDGTLIGSPVTLELAYDLWPLWLRIAIVHERMAKEARARLESLSGSHDQRHAAALDDETTAGMVAVAAAVFAVDAFYGSVCTRIDTPPPRGRRSRRYALIAETFKRAFLMSQPSSNALRQHLREAFRFRDKSVHPSGEFRGAVRHPVMRVGVAVPHVAFRVENAQALVTFVISLIEQCAGVPKDRHKNLREWCKGIPPQILELKRLREET
jgi:hypothetical protein